MTIHELDKWLKKSGISANEFAQIMGITRFTISKWRERGAVPAKQVPRVEAALERHPQILRQMKHPPTRSLFE